MSHKQSKRDRKIQRELLREIEPIAAQAAYQLKREGPEMFAKWAAIAAQARLLMPELPLKEFLPDKLDETLDRFRDDLLALHAN
jgi:hypothetical protein